MISRGYPTKKYNLNGIFEFEQAKALASTGNKVVLAALDMRSARRFRRWGFKSIIKDGVNIEAINIPIGGSPKKIFDFICQVALKLLYHRIKRKHGVPDIVHAHFIHNGCYVAKALRHENLPLFLTEHFSALYSITDNPHLMKMGEYTYHRFDKVFAVSPALAQIIQDNFHIVPIVIPNIVDCSCFRYYERKHKSKQCIFVSVSLLNENKRTSLLVDAFCEAFSSTDNVLLNIIGSGPEKNKIVHKIENNNRSHQIKLLGTMDHFQIADSFKDSDCFVLVSRKETFGLAYIEAMATGLPVIATKSGGPDSFVNYENGLLVPVDDFSALIAALQQMRETISDYNGELISKRIYKEFSPKIIAERLLEQYEEVLSGR